MSAPAGTTGGRPLLALEDVSRRFGSLVAVDGVSLTVEAGERRAVIGPNGAGKSTLFAVIAGTLKASAGRVFFAGREVTRLSEHRRAELGIGRTFQHSKLFDGLPIHDNVALAVQRHAGVSRRFVRPARSFAGIDDRVAELLEAAGLADRRDVLAGSLSHGERRQLEIAMALAGEPRLLLLDEPVAGMSPSERAAFVERIAALPKTLTVVIVEHDIDVVFALASRISVLHAGALLAEGTPDEIAASPEVEEAYLGRERTEEVFQG